MAPGKKITYTNEEKEDYARATVYVKDYLYRNIAVNVGNPGDMVTGNSFVAFSSDHAREVICELVDNDMKETVREIHLGLCAIVKIINSQKRTVNTDALRELSKSVHLKIVQTFPWAVISQSVHRILAHSADRIELNNCMGLGSIGEEGLEALNKWIRRMDQSGSRADSTTHRFTDIFYHLWDCSRPNIVEMERKIRRKKPKVVISTEIEMLVESLFLD